MPNPLDDARAGTVTGLGGCGLSVSGPYRAAAAFYDRYRPQYSAELVHFILGLTTERREYLDIGCGTGALLFELAPHFTQAIGVDVDPDMLDVAASKRERDGYPPVGLIHRSAESYLEVRSTRSISSLRPAQSTGWTSR